MQQLFVSRCRIKFDVSRYCISVRKKWFLYVTRALSGRWHVSRAREIWQGGEYKSARGAKKARRLERSALLERELSKETRAKREVVVQGRLMNQCGRSSQTAWSAIMMRVGTEKNDLKWIRAGSRRRRVRIDLGRLRETHTKNLTPTLTALGFFTSLFSPRTPNTPRTFRFVIST